MYAKSFQFLTVFITFFQRKDILSKRRLNTAPLSKTIILKKNRKKRIYNLPTILLFGKGNKPTSKFHFNQFAIMKSYI